MLRKRGSVRLGSSRVLVEVCFMGASGETEQKCVENKLMKRSCKNSEQSLYCLPKSSVPTLSLSTSSLKLESNNDEGDRISQWPQISSRSSKNFHFFDHCCMSFFHLFMILSMVYVIPNKISTFSREYFEIENCLHLHVNRIASTILPLF